MNLTLPLISVVLQVFTTIYCKYLLNRRKINLGWFLSIEFGLMSLFSFLLLFSEPNITWLPPLSNQLKFVFLSIPLLGTAWNYLYFRALKHEPANVVEVIMLLVPLAIISWSMLLGQTAFRLPLVLCVTAATFILFFGYSHHKKLEFDSSVILLIFAVIIDGLENVAVSHLLNHSDVSPVLLFALRTLFISAVFTAAYRPKLNKLKLGDLVFIIPASTIGSVMMLSRFYGFRLAGLVSTALVLLLAPVLTFKFSHWILREKITRRHVVSAAMVVVVVIFALAIKA